MSKKIKYPRLLHPGTSACCILVFCISFTPPDASADYASWDWSTGDWTDAARWSSDPNYPNNGQPDPGDTWTVNVSSGTITRNISPTISTLDFSGGRIQGTGSLTVTGSASWSGGRFETGNVNFNGGASITGNTVLSGGSTTLTLASGQTVSITGSGALTLDSAAKLTNSGTLLASNDNGIYETGTGSSSFTNNGTFTRDTGTGTFMVASQIFENHGTVNVDTGTLEFSSGMDTDGHVQIAAGATLSLGSASVFMAGASFGGTGSLILNDGTTQIHSSLAIPNLLRLDPAAALSVHDGHTVTLGGAFNWNGGMLAGGPFGAGRLHGFYQFSGGATVKDGAEIYYATVTNPAAAVTSIAADANLQFSEDAVLSNAGTLSLAEGSRLYSNFEGGEELINNGSLVANANSMIQVPFTNSGTTTAAAGDVEVNGGGSSTGNFHAASGARVLWKQDYLAAELLTGDYHFNPGTTFTGDGVFVLGFGSHSLAGSLTTSAEFDISSNLHVPLGHSFTHNGDLSFNGRLSGGGSLVGNSTVGLSDGSVTASTLRISSAAAASQQPFYSITLHNGGILRNEGTLNTVAPSGIRAGTGSGNRFENAGNFVVGDSEHPPEFSIDTHTISSELVNTGAVTVESGKLALTGGGTSTGGTWSVATDEIIELSSSFTFAGTNTASGAGSWIFGTEGGAGAAVSHALSGTLSLGAPTTLGNATLVLDPAATVTATAAFDALKGTLTGGGVFHANGGTTVGDLTIEGATLNLGTGSENIHATTTPITLANDGTITNAGTFRARGDFNMGLNEFSIISSGGSPSFSNSGTFVRDVGNGSYVVAVPFHNSGAVSSQSGTLLLLGGGTSTDGTWDATNGSLDLSGDFVFNGSTTITGTYIPSFGDGVFTVNGPLVSAPGLVLEGATNLAIQPGQIVTLNGMFRLEELFADMPVISGGGTVNAASDMIIRAGAIDGATLNLAAGQSATHVGTLPLTLKNTGVFNNAGIYRAEDDGSITQDVGTGNIFHNSGTFIRDLSLGTFTISAPFENSGTVGAEMGTLSFTGELTSTGSFGSGAAGAIEFSGNSSFDSATPFTGAGPIRITAGTHGFVQSGVSTADLTISGGAVTVPAGITLDSTGATHWTGGTLGGTGTLQTTGGLDLSGETTLIDSVLAVPAGASAVQSAAGNLLLDGASIVENAGTWHAANALSISPGTAGTQAFHNSGTFLRDTDPGTFVVAVPLHNTGTVGVASGILSLQGDGSSSGEFNVIADTDLSLSGANTFSGDSSFTGAGRINLQAGTQTIADTMPSSAIVNLSGSTLAIQPSQIFQSGGSFHWTAGPVTGGGTLETSGALDLTMPALPLDGAVLSSTALGTISLDSLGSLALANGATIENLGFTMLLNDGSITAADASAVAFNNSGTVTRDTGTGTFTIAVPFNHSGLLNLNTGSLALNGGGTASNSTIHTLAGTGLYVGPDYTFGPNNVITGAGATHFSNGSLHVTGSLTTDGSFNWTGGTLDGGGTFTVKDGLSIAPTAGVFIDGTTLENAAGSEAVISGTAGTHILNGGTYRNSGLTRLQGTNNFTDDGGGANSIVNSGTLIRDDGTGNYTITLPIHNTGTIRSTSGALLLNAGGSSTAGLLDADGGDIYLNGGSYEFSGGAITGANSIYLSAGSALVTGDTGATSGPATGGFGIAGGTLGGTAMLSVDHGYFSSGNVIGSPTLRLTGISSKSDSTVISMSGGTILNEGTFTQAYQANWDLDTAEGEGGGTIHNTGTWNLTAASIFANSYGGGKIENSGAFNQSGGGNMVFSAFHNLAGGAVNSTAGYIYLQGGGSVAAGSVLNADGGDIYFNGGTHALAGGTLTGANFTYATAGVASVDGDVGAPSGPATGGFGISSGTVTGSAMLSADHGYFASGHLAGTAVLRFTGASTKADSTLLNLSGGTIRNEGTFTQVYQANWDLDASEGEGGGTIENTGTLNLTNSSTFANSYGGGKIDNSGAFNQAGGGNIVLAAFHNLPGGAVNSTAGYIYLQGGGSVAAGSVLNADGGDIYFNGGTHLLNGGSITGENFTFTTAGVASVDGDVGAPSGPATGGFGIAGGTVTGSAMLSADHGYFASGHLAGTAVLRFTGASTKADSTLLNLSGGTIRNEGTFTQVYQANWDLDASEGGGGGTIENTGTWTLTSGSSFANSYGGGKIENSGAYNQAGGGNIVLAAFHNLPGGAVHSTAGYIYLQGGGSVAAGSVLNADGGDIYFNGGTHLLNGGSITGENFTFTTAGVASVDGDVGAPSGPATGGFGIAGGTVTGSAMLSADHGYFASGHLAGTAVLRFTGASTKSDSTLFNLSGGTLRNEGTFTQAHQANWDLDASEGEGGGTIENHGTWTLSDSSTFANSYGGGMIENHGTLSQTGGANHIFPPVINSGTIRAEAGTLYLRGGSTHTGSLVADGHIWLYSGTHTMSGTGASLNGIGALSGNLTISDGAKLSPGNSTGTLSLYGAVSFVPGGAAPSYLAEIAGPSSSDRVFLGDGTTMELGSGLTNLQIALSYAPAPGAVFRIIDSTGSGNFTGTFANLPVDGAVTTASFDSQTYHFRINYGASGKTADLTVLNPFEVWAYSKGLSGDDAGFNADPDQDGISNGIEFVIGGEPNPATPGSASQALLPQITLDGTYLRVVWRRTAASAYLNPAVEFDAGLSGPWTLAENGVDGVTVTITTDGFAAGIDRVEALIPRSHEMAGRLFARLAVIHP